jgi:CheY-like chemotaxis protein
MAAKILVVDDEPDIRTFLRTLFAKEGYDVQTAENGDEAIAKAQQDKPALIFLDIMMPKKTGILAYRRLKKDAALAEVPVVILTGLSQYKTFFAQDFDHVPQPEAFIEKPPKKERLIEIAKELIPAGESG